LIDLANINSKFVYLPKKLVGYRVIIKEENNDKKEEDLNVRKNLYTKWYFNHFINK
jgi:hypothetical protein